MAIAITGASRLQDLSDVDVTPAVGEDEKVLVYDHDVQQFVLKASAAGVTDHGLLDAASLLDDDHTQYALLAGRAGGATIYGGTAANDDITIHGTSNATRTTSYVLLQPTAGSVGIGLSAPERHIHARSAAAAFRIDRGDNSVPFFVLTGYTDATYTTVAKSWSVGGIGSQNFLISDLGTGVSGSGTVRLFINGSTGAIGMGTTGPNAPLHIEGSAFPVLAIVRLTSETATFASGMTMVTRSSGDAADGFGGGLVFCLQDTGVGNYFGGVLAAVGAVRAGADNSGDLVLRTYSSGAATEWFRVTSAGSVGIGTPLPATRLHALLTSAATNAVTNVVTIGHDTSGTAAAGFGAGQLFTLESSTTAAQSAARIVAAWNDATHATRKADLFLSAYDTAEREGLRIRANGTAAAIGFLGTTPSAQIAHVADASVAYGAGDLDTEAEVIDAINATNGKINSILATLEAFGFHASA